MRILAFVIAVCFSSVFSKTDTLQVVNCKCDTLTVIKSVDTTITVKLDTLNVNEEKTEKKSVKSKK